MIKELLIDDKTYLDHYYINNWDDDTGASRQLKNVKEDLTFDRLLSSFRALKDKTVHVQILFLYSTNKYTRKHAAPPKDEASALYWQLKLSTGASDIPAASVTASTPEPVSRSIEPKSDSGLDSGLGSSLGSKPDSRIDSAVNSEDVDDASLLELKDFDFAKKIAKKFIPVPPNKGDEVIDIRSESPEPAIKDEMIKVEPAKQELVKEQAAKQTVTASDSNSKKKRSVSKVINNDELAKALQPQEQKKKKEAIKVGPSDRILRQRGLLQ